MVSWAILAAASAPLAWALSPPYTAIFEHPLIIAPVATPNTSTTVDGQQIDFFEITVQPFQKQIYPDLGPANLVGYNGHTPGPTFYVQKGTQTVLRFYNNHTDDSVTHLHGSWTHSPWDGWASDEIKTGQFKDYYYPNDQGARSLWYHDHADSITSSNCFKGLTAAYIIYDPAEDSLGLPTGKYDVPLMLSDKMYQSNGDLVSVRNEQNDFFGDIIEVNSQPWPFFEVEPRKYRLRFYNVATSRPFDLHVEKSNGDWIDFQVIGSDSGLFGSPVTANDVVISMGERYEVVVDFSHSAGQNLTLKNTYTSDSIQAFENTDLVMSFVVQPKATDLSSNNVPSTLNTAIAWPESKTEVDHTFRFSFGGDNHWTINGVDFNDVQNRVLARPPQGSTEVWELVYASGPGVHPVHMHLVDFQIISRTGGRRGVLPYESAGMKDVVLLESGETVKVRVYYGPWNGLYMFHCHNLIHEDHMMMAAYNVTALAGLGYDNVEGLDDPADARFAAENSSPDAYSEGGIQSKLSYLGSLGAYNHRTEIQSALSAYIATNPSAAVETGTDSPAGSQAYATPNAGGGSFGGESGAQNSGAHGAAPSQTQGFGGHSAAPSQAQSSVAHSAAPSQAQSSVAHSAASSQAQQSFGAHGAAPSPTQVRGQGSNAASGQGSSWGGGGSGGGGGGGSSNKGRNWRA